MLRLTVKKWAILFCLISPTALSFSEEIYHWTDDKGSVHFTDDISNIPAPYLNQVHKREMTRGISNETLEWTDSGLTSEMPAEKTKQPVFWGQTCFLTLPNPSASWLTPLGLLESDHKKNDNEMGRRKQPTKDPYVDSSAHRA